MEVIGRGSWLARHHVADAAHIANPVAAQFAAQGVDVHFDGVAADFFLPAIEALFELAARERHAGGFHECMQDAEFACREGDFVAVEAHFVAGRIERQRAVFDDRRRPAGTAAQQGAQAGAELSLIHI